MWALEHPSAPRAERLLAETPRALLAVLALGAAATLALVELAVLPPSAIRVAGITVGHGALLATALGWARRPPTAAVLAVCLVGLAAMASGQGALGSLAYLVTPI